MRIPQEIIDNVIAAVGEDDTDLLKRCSLVSSSFLHPIRKLLFSSVTLENDQSCEEIHKFLVQNPVIQSFVRSISLKHMSMPKSAQWMNGTSLLSILRLPLCRLECFLIAVDRESWMNWNWDSFGSEMKDAILNIIHSSALKTLSLTGLTEVPITIFHIVHLTTLELHSLSPNDFIGENSCSLTPTDSKGAVMASQTVIDRCVWRFSARETRQDTIEVKFLPFLSRLRLLEIHIELFHPTLYNLYDLDILSLLMDSICISLTYPATLEHLELNIRFHDYIIDVENPLSENFRGAWSHLDPIMDPITSHSTGSRLQRVDININYSFRLDAIDDDGEFVVFDEDGLLESVFDGLPLLRKKGILFVKAALVECPDFKSEV